MKVSVGNTTSIYRTRLPHQHRLEMMAKRLNLSQKTRVRLTWLAQYKTHKNASMTAKGSGTRFSSSWKKW